MCLIAYAPKCKSQIPSKHLRNGHGNNSDAWGIMFPSGDNRLTLLKDVTPFDSFRTYWKASPTKTPIAAHFRFATAGAKDASMAHPFSVLTMNQHGVELALMHNGVLSSREFPGRGSQSDTAQMVDELIRPDLESNPGLIESSGWRNMLGRFIDSGNKLLFMRGDGQVWIVNAEEGVTKPGNVWYSNTYSLEAAWKKYLWWDNDDYSKYVPADSSATKGTGKWDFDKGVWKWREGSLADSCSVIPIQSRGVDKFGRSMPRTEAEESEAADSDWMESQCTERARQFVRKPDPDQDETDFEYITYGPEQLVADDLSISDLPSLDYSELLELAEERPDIAAELLLRASRD